MVCLSKPATMALRPTKQTIGKPVWVEVATHPFRTEVSDAPCATESTASVSLGLGHHRLSSSGKPPMSSSSGTSSRIPDPRIPTEFVQERLGNTLRTRQRHWVHAHLFACAVGDPAPPTSTTAECGHGTATVLIPRPICTHRKVEVVHPRSGIAFDC